MPIFAERPARERKHALSEAILRLPESHPDPRSVLLKTFVKLFSLYTTTGEPPPSFDVSLTANLVLYSAKRKSWGFYYGQNFDENNGRTSLALTTTYRVDSLSDLHKIPVAVPVEAFGDAFDRTFSDTETVVESIAAVVYVIEKILKDFSKDRVNEKAGYVKLF
jgi:hypothetical protein